MTTVQRALRLLATTTFIALLGFTAPATAADQTWTGQISDSMCKTKHEEAAEGQGKMSERECTLSCVKGGSKFVLIAGGKVLAIANQDHPDLMTFAGQTVTIHGDLKGDAITVARIEAAK